MIVDYIENLKRYKGITPNLDLALDYLMEHDVDAINGKVNILGEEVFLTKQYPNLVPYNERGWENHFAYMDIHVAVEGTEVMGVLNSPDLLGWNEIIKDRDIEFSNDDVDSQKVCLKPGMCVILWPGEPHKPNTGEGKYTKIVVKVKMS